jgi:hypothetical protein
VHTLKNTPYEGWLLPDVFEWEMTSTSTARNKIFPGGL